MKGHLKEKEDRLNINRITDLETKVQALTEIVRLLRKEVDRLDNKIDGYDEDGCCKL